MTAHLITTIQTLEELGFTVLGYHRGNLRVAGMGWRSIEWAYRIIDRRCAA